tara:strand:+ start:398 stop:556 length:159 start_codon:yes stop_codon:yes gene_type:complete
MPTMNTNIPKAKKAVLRPGNLLQDRKFAVHNIEKQRGISFCFDVGASEKNDE